MTLWPRFLLVVLVILLACPASAEGVPLTTEERAYIEENPVLKVHAESNWPPFNFTEYGEPTGFVNDYMRLLSGRLGMRLEFIEGYTWAQYVEMLKDGRIDVVSNMKITPDRRAFALFSERPTVHVVQGVLTREGERSIATASQLVEFGLTVAVVKGYYQEELLRRYYPQVPLLLAQDVPDLIRLVVNGKADAGLAAHSVMDHYVRRNFYTGLQNRILKRDHLFPHAAQYLGIRIDKPVLKRILDKGMAAIPDAEVAQLRGKWMSSTTLTQTATLQLTNEQLEYLENKRVIRLCADPDWLPLEAIENGRHVGVAADVMERFSSMLGIPVRLLETGTWTDSLAAAKLRRCDVLAMLMQTDERREYLTFTQPYLHVPLVVATRIEVPYMPHARQLIGKRIGIVQGYSAFELLAERYPGIDIVEVDSVDDGLRRVDAGELYGMVDSLTTLTYAIQANYHALKIAGQFDELLSFRVGVRSDDPMLLGLLNKAIAAIPQSELQGMLNRHMPAPYEAPKDYSWLWQLGLLVLLVMSLMVYRHLMLQRYNRKLESLSTTDPLTRLANRLKLDESLDHQEALAQRYAYPYSVILCDIDHFKQVNDKHGHLVGDEVLVKFAELLSETVRETDLVGRWGGEEFLVICPNTESFGAQRIAQDMQKRLRARSFLNVGQLTASFGTATRLPGEGDKQDQVISAVDKALYRSKNTGRNRISVAPIILGGEAK